MLRRAFALVELLLVLAMIGILAAIAVPRFTEHQYRTKLSRVKSDMRTLAGALEAYKLDRGAYPWDGTASAYGPPSAYYGGVNVLASFGQANFNNMLTTPVAYVTSAYWQDPYQTNPGFGRYRYVNIEGTYNIPPLQSVYERYAPILGNWQIVSNGPDGVLNIQDPSYSLYWVCTVYDPTNGLMSRGDILWTQRNADGALPPPAGS